MITKQQNAIAKSILGNSIVNKSNIDSKNIFPKYFKHHLISNLHSALVNNDKIKKQKTILRKRPCYKRKKKKNVSPQNIIKPFSLSISLSKPKLSLTPNLKEKEEDLVSLIKNSYDFKERSKKHSTKKVEFNLSPLLYFTFLLIS